jgi:hypothetical protein
VATHIARLFALSERIWSVYQLLVSLFPTHGGFAEDNARLMSKKIITAVSAVSVVLGCISFYRFSSHVLA